MTEKVQIISYRKDQKIQTNYIELPDQNTGLPFYWFKIGPTRDIKLLNQGAKECLEYQTGQKWKLITGLLPIYKNVYFGDIDKETIGIHIDHENDLIHIALFRGHRPKLRTARKKRVINFITEQKNKG